MPKQAPNITPAEILEQGGSAIAPELMFSVITGNGAALVDVEAGNTQGQLVTPGDKSSLQACIRYDDAGPLEDFVNVASFSDGKLNPGKNIGSSRVLVYWLHYPGDGDSAASWN